MPQSQSVTACCASQLHQHPHVDLTGLSCCPPTLPMITAGSAAADSTAASHASASQMFSWVPPEHIAAADRYRQGAVLNPRKRSAVAAAEYVIEPEPHDMRTQHKKVSTYTHVWILTPHQKVSCCSEGQCAAQGRIQCCLKRSCTVHSY